MNQLHSKVTFMLFLFPSQSSHHNCCLWFSWCELKTQLCETFCPRLGKCLPRSIFPSRVKPGLSFNSSAKTLHTHEEEPKRIAGVFSADAINYVGHCGRHNLSALTLVIPKEKALRSTMYPRLEHPTKSIQTYKLQPHEAFVFP